MVCPPKIQKITKRREGGGRREGRGGRRRLCEKMQVTNRKKRKDEKLRIIDTENFSQTTGLRNS